MSGKEAICEMQTFKSFHFMDVKKRSKIIFINVKNVTKTFVNVQ